MGWWSKDILGGDTPYDFKDEFYGICDTNEYPDEGGRNLISNESFQKGLPRILEYIEKTGDDKEIGYQVLGVMMMESKAEISSELKEKMISSAKEDYWSQHDEERKAKMVAFIEALSSYDGKKAVVIRSKGLFETIAEHISSGKTGLVNKDPL